MTDYMRLDWSALSVPARIAIVADTHAEIDAAVATALGEAGAVVHAGDVGADRVVEAMRARGRPAIAVRGNNDTTAKWQGKARPEALPLVVHLALPGGELVIVHGHRHNPASRRHAVLRAAYPDAKAVVYGHSHRQICDFDERPWILNPGAAGRARTYGGAGWLWLHVDRRHRWRVEACRATDSGGEGRRRARTKP